ncbi:hypothetical protein LEP1GSC191_0013 [Leptospira borgpetersenii serovar Mini str. 201000851]|uniref:Uncharacterized protein n=2 Tax=Leptospira borgpetersenii TaxID=174 RepID=M3FCK9_LEPBO|nr:hypothetical protein LEP1GSC128_2789 [Leptospira borgpetersenii str. 200801926]EMF99567.1 hypothetical protein LEP1GSC123_2892 [Leptospira borgpetersenii str. 200701203]ENO61700.1 hypothetical protein LEP1GSC191_0013 [Leptospira borgpetersenii serovar Mini str. 201000851]
MFTKAGPRSPFQSATQHFNLFVYSDFFIPTMLHCRIYTSIAFAVVDRCQATNSFQAELGKIS